ncbi:hypothetical protein ACFLVH_02735 [Chloroflexota bacterium]
MGKEFEIVNHTADAGCAQAVRPIITITTRTDNTFSIQVTSRMTPFGGGGGDPTSL